MNCVHHGDLNFANFLRPALVHTGNIGHTFRFKPTACLMNRDHARFEFLAEFNGVSDVIEVAVRYQHCIDAIDFFERLGRHRIRLNPRIYQDHVTGGSSDAKRGMAEPREFVSASLKHREPPKEMNWYGWTNSAPNAPPLG
jgi:hypothetical protein